MDADRLVDELLTLVPRRRGHFRLESGDHGDLWLDLEALFLRPALLRPFAAALALRLHDLAIEAVCGPLVGGAFLAQMVADELDVEFYYTERVATAVGSPCPVNYQLPNTLRLRVANKGVAVVDDAINAGSAVQATWLDLQACGARLAALGTLLVLGPHAARLAEEWRVPLVRVAHLPGQLWAPEACPLCALCVPLDDGAPTQPKAQ